MKRWLIALLAILALAAPATASAATPTNQYFYGVGTPGADARLLTNAEVDRAAPWAGSGRFSIRLLFDKRIADQYGPNDAWDAYLERVGYALYRGVQILPIIGWTTGSSNPDQKWRKPTTQAEKDALQTFAGNVAGIFEWYHLNWGSPMLNVVEAYNEPNCMVNGTPAGPGDCDYGGWSSITDYKTNGFDPIAVGVRSHGVQNVMVGGLGFGCTSKNGFEDASAWVSQWEALGYAAGSNGYSVHPYGYSSPTFSGTGACYPRQDISLQNSARAYSEFSRVCGPATDGVYVTETGKRTDYWGQASQTNFLQEINIYMQSKAIGIMNYLLEDRPEANQSYGILNSNMTDKLSWPTWRDNGQSWAGVLGGSPAKDPEADCVV